MPKRPESEPKASLVIDIPDEKIEPGDAVRIKGEPGTWRFRARRRHLVTGFEWVDVFGGIQKQECVRSFRPDRVTKINRRKSP